MLNIIFRVSFCESKHKARHETKKGKLLSPPLCECHYQLNSYIYLISNAVESISRDISEKGRRN